MTKQAPQSLRELWGPIGQIGYIVHDLATAMRRWTDTVGVGDGKIWGVEFSYLHGDRGGVIEVADLPDDMRAARNKAFVDAAQWNDAPE